MSTPQSELLAPAVRLLEAEAPDPVALDRLYDAVERAVALDADDRVPPTLRGRPTQEPGWHRNLRNALKAEKVAGRLANVAPGSWTVARPDADRHVDPDRAWADVLAAARRSVGDVFESPSRGQRYRVASADDERIRVDRLDASEPATLSPGEVRRAVVALNAAGGRTGARTLHYTVVKETALVHLHPDLGWDGDQIVARAEAEADAGGRPVGPEEGRRYWALAADPRRYRVEDAVRELDRPDLWTTRGRDLRPGDRVVVWRTSGGGGQRGVVALGEVAGPVRDLADADNPYWVEPEDETGPRVPVRYVVPPGLPLYLGDDGDGPARALSVARARGGTVFNLAPEEWDALVAGVGDFDVAVAEAEADAEEDRVRASDMDPTEREQVVRARRGQGVFRRRVEAIESGCRLTGTTDRSVLIAGHVKPWRVATDAERLDGHNGLLLAPHVDRLFDAGRISFADDGRVLVADDATREEMGRWGLDPDAVAGPFGRRQREYLAYHREEVYRGPTSVS